MSEREEAIRRWREAEDRLYPVVTVRTDLYEAVIGIVRSLADHLDGVPDLDALVTSYLASTPAADLEAAGIERDVAPTRDRRRHGPRRGVSAAIARARAASIVRAGAARHRPGPPCGR